MDVSGIRGGVLNQFTTRNTKEHEGRVLLFFARVGAPCGEMATGHSHPAKGNAEKC